VIGGLLRARSRFPEIVENIENRRQRIESLEHPNALAKQVLSQLSHAPTVAVTLVPMNVLNHWFIDVGHRSFSPEHCIHCCQIYLAFVVRDDLGLTRRYSRALRELVTNSRFWWFFFGFLHFQRWNPGIATKLQKPANFPTKLGNQ
jgi:hypothetical protein